MQVCVYYNNHDLRLEERPIPKIGLGEILLRVEASGICGTDLMEWYRIDKAPLILGHEVAGVIETIGKDVSRYSIGDRITAAHHVPCNVCHYCLNGHHTVCDTLRKTNFDPGGFAEFVRLPSINVDRGVYLLPEEVSFEEATFIEPLACVFRGQRMARLKPGNSVVIMGSGISGLLHIKLARAMGSGCILATDLSGYRLEMARNFGADMAVKPQEDTDLSLLLADINDGRKKADLVVICTGNPKAISEALQLVDRGGTVLFFASAPKDFILPLPVNDLFWRNEITFTSSYAGSPADHTVALNLIRSGTVKVKDMITHRLSLSETGLGFELVERAQDSLKVIIEPQK